MIAIYDSNYIPESYKSYKGKAFQKTKEKINSLMWGIKSNSLKKEDKEKLRLELIELCQSFQF